MSALAEIKDHHEVNDNKSTLYGKIAQVMGELKRLPKTGQNKHFKYSYVTSEDVADAVRQALSDAGIAFFATVIGFQRDGQSTIVEMEFTFGCNETGASIPCRWFGESNDKQDKGLSKAYTNAEKYFLLKTFIIGTGDEADTDAESIDRNVVEPAKEIRDMKSLPARPWQPEVLKDYIFRKAAEDNSPALPEAFNGVYAAWSNLGVTDEERRRIQRYFFDLDSSKEYTAGHCHAIKAWIGAKKETVEGQDIWVPSAHAIAEKTLLLAGPCSEEQPALMEEEKTA